MKKVQLKMIYSWKKIKLGKTLQASKCVIPNTD